MQAVFTQHKIIHYGTYSNMYKHMEFQNSFLIRTVSVIRPHSTSVARWTSTPVSGERTTQPSLGGTKIAGRRMYVLYNKPNENLWAAFLL
jgi:hypothetical protein